MNLQRHFASSRKRRRRYPGPSVFQDPGGETANPGRCIAVAAVSERELPAGGVANRSSLPKQASAPVGAVSNRDLPVGRIANRSSLLQRPIGFVGAVSNRESRPIPSPPSSPESRVPSPGISGFTLVELILVILLVGILSAVGVVFIVPPFQAAVAIEQRATLVDAADSALTRIGREARNALPNSVRVHNAGHVEFITTRTGGRYRRLPAPGGGSQILVPARNSDTFDVPGSIPGAEAIASRGPGTNCAAGNGDCVSVFNTMQPGFNAYDRQNIAAITGASATSISYDSGGAGPAFTTHSPRQRFYVVDDVVSYVCNGGELRRFSGYGLQSGVPALGGGELVAENVTGCQFTFNPGTATRRGLLTLRIDMARGGEQVFLIAQAQVMNAP